MKKKVVSLLLICALAASMAACGATDDTSSTVSSSESSAEAETADEVTESSLSDAYEAFAACIDLAFTEELINTISSFGDDEATGNRSSGSAAEADASNYVKSVMEEIGLQNVTVDETTLDGWTYKGANIAYTNADGEEVTVTLGGYATEIVAEDEEISIVYVGQGTAADYEGIDVTDKLVLLEVNQDEDWWINYPAYEAKIHGARAVIAMTIMEVENLTRISVQDICGPADAPALAISQADYEGIIAAIEATGEGELSVIFNADSTITYDTTSQNVWGEIPGKSDEVIYIIGHVDGYFHSTYDDVSGISTVLGIAKAIIDSGYVPEKTIRIVAHGAEEWGHSGNEYDWAAGAYEEITTIHPEWAETAFALINIDGAYAVQGEDSLGVVTSYELLSFVEESGSVITDDCGYEYIYFSPTGTYTEDFGWSEYGIPTIVATSGNDCIYNAGMYHSTMDSFEGGELDENILLINHQLFGKILLDLDATSVRPMEFTARFDALEESLDTDLVTDEELYALVAQAQETAAALEEMMAQVEASGDADAAVALNSELYTLFKTIQDAFLKLDYELNVVFPTEQYQNNIWALDETIAALEEGDIETAVDEYLWEIDWAWYSMYFSTETCKYFENQLWENRVGTWGDGMVDYQHCDIDAVTKSLCEKYGTDADVTEEIAELQELRAQQAEYLATEVEEEKEALVEIIALMEAICE